MAKNDINSKPYDEATTLKLDIFRKCFREWLPVFIYDPSVSNLYIYDMFAGSGHDSNGNMGSPLILLDEAKGKECRYCNFLSKNQNKKVIFGFNEKEYQKVEQLKKTKDAYLAECRENCEHDECVYYKNIHCQSQTFDQILLNSRFNDILKSKSYAKFILLDQYGFSQITDDVFLKLVNSPLTDFIFFISSSFVKRFKEHPNITKYLDTKKMHFEESKPKECHRIIADYFRNLVDSKKEYYIHHFTI